MEIVLASGNSHKCEEISSVLPGGYSLSLQSTLGISSPPETGTTFVENALIKAHHACSESGLPALADDSGLCVAALGNQPGVRSARYAGDEATDQDNYQKLLSAMEGIDERDATFHCVLVFLSSLEDPAPLIAEGVWHGTITSTPRGEKGFGYDPVFFIPSLGRTAAELTHREKNKLSHRGKALLTLIEVLSDRYSS